MKKLFLIFLTLFSIFTFSGLIIAQEMDPLDTSIREIQPIIIIPVNHKGDAQNYDTDEALEKINNLMDIVQQRYEKLLDGHTFIVRKAKVKYLDHVSVGGINSNAVATNLLIPYTNYMEQIMTFESGIRTSETLPLMFVVGAPSEGSNLIQPHTNNLAATGLRNAYIWVSGPILNDIVFSDKNDRQSLNKSLHAIAHEIGHIFGSSGHPCTEASQQFCSWLQLANKPLPPDEEFTKGIMGYNNEPFDSQFFNNSVHNPEIQSLMRNPSINPNGDPIPEPDNVYQLKEGVGLRTSQVNLYPGSTSPLSIAGNKFGSQQGKVELTLIYPGFNAEQKIIVPDDLVQWSNDLITVSLSDSYIGSPLKIKVTIITPDNKKIPVEGEVDTYSTRRTDTSITPETARNGSEVVISGNNFGDSGGDVIFADFSSGKPVPTKLPIISWTNDQIVISLTLPLENLPPGVSFLILPTNSGGFPGGSIKIEQNNQVTQDIFFRISIQCTDPNLKPKPGDIGVLIDNSLGTLTPSSSGFTDSNGRISFLIPVTFDYGNPKNITFTLTRNGQTIDQQISVYPSTQDTDIRIDDPSCAAPAETAFDSYSVLISNNPSYNDNDFNDGSGTLQLAGQPDERTIDWIPSNQGDQTIFISKITLDGNQEFQITGSNPGDIVNIPNTNIKLLINSAPRQSTAPDAQVIEEQPVQELAAPPACNTEPWSNKDTNGLYRCEGNQACYVQWQENTDNSCQPQEIGEYCEYNDDCDSRQNTSEPLDALAPNEEEGEGQDQLEEL